MKVFMLLIWFLPILFFVGLNYYQIVIKKMVPHPYKKNNILKVVVAGVFFAFSGFNIWYAGYQFFCFGTFFDPALNILRHKAPDYTGRKNWTDRFVKWTGIPMIMLTFIEFILTLLFMTLYWTGWNDFTKMVIGDYNWNNWIW